MGPDAPLVPLFWGGLALGIMAAIGAPRRIIAWPLRTGTFAAVLATATGHALLLRPPAAVLMLDAAAAGLALAALSGLRYVAGRASTTGSSSRLP